ncbi:insulinase family protein [Kaustia mangrovi]|uniref:Insulinase family protein n=1 Tax=Kaustia mangrovi TaxID=2593653 RepID=A0A7S8HDZ9_9HYPH|nr:pitrilysin family protein [Kaustia mangrovi]QPC44848.1 insulinase family protein [Kaustia mangrovi]
MVSVNALLRPVRRLPAGAACIALGLAAATALTAAPLAPARAEKAAKPPAGSAQFAQNVSTFTLDNGMQVVVIPDHRAPVVTHMVWYRVGAADEPKGKSGIAHFLEHLMFKGTETVPPGEFSKIVRRNGGEDNAFTGQDYTAYYQRIAKDRLPLVMKLEADRMVNLQLDEKNVGTELEVIKEERRMRVDNEPSSRLNEQVDAALYVAHPYGTPVIGWPDEMAGLTLDDALSFYRTYYTPRNAILVVAGDVTADEVKSLAETYYGPLQNTGAPGARERVAEPAPQAERLVTLRDAKVPSPSVRRSYLATSYSRAEPGEAEALDILAYVLGDGTTSRLYRDLVVDKKIATYAGAWYSGDGLDYGTIGVYAAPVPGHDIADVEAELDTVLADVVENGITGKELADAKRSLLAETVYALDSQVRLARVFGIALTTGLDVDAVRDWPARIEAVTLDEVKAAARKYLAPERSVTGLLLKPARAAATGATETAPEAKTNGETES